MTDNDRKRVRITVDCTDVYPELLLISEEEIRPLSWTIRILIHEALVARGLRNQTNLTIESLKRKVSKIEGI